MILKSKILNLKSQFNQGFTLIELLVVIAIISILIAVGSVSYIRAVRLSRDSKRKTDLEQIRQALETYRSENGIYPTESGSLPSGLTPDFINTLPLDPKNPTSVYTYTRPSTTTYSLCATLESATPASYCVTQP